MVTRTRDNVADTPVIGVADEVERWLRLRSLVVCESPALPGLADVRTLADRFEAQHRAALGVERLEVISGDFRVLGSAPTSTTWAGLSIAEGRSFLVDFAPGAVRLRTRDVARAEHSDERAAKGARALADAMAGYLTAGDAIPEGTPTRSITEWSARSRARMFQTVAMLDLSTFMDLPGDTAMVTLTLPGDWLAVAPTGRIFKRLVDRFRKRWIRAGMLWASLWKLEFQRRGAPHLHFLARVPALVNPLGYDASLGYGVERFEAWLSRTWAEVVAADDRHCHRCSVSSCECSAPDTERSRHLAAGTGVDFDMAKMSDPRRIAVYFLGHSSKHTDGKEYQHIVPEAWHGAENGPGRFWGYTGLTKAVGTVEVERRAYVALQRVLRHVATARTWKRTAERARHGSEHPVRHADGTVWASPCARRCVCSDLERRRSWSLGSAGGWGGGTVVVNDGVTLGYDLARYLAGPQYRTAPTGVAPEGRRVLARLH